VAAGMSAFPRIRTIYLCPFKRLTRLHPLAEGFGSEPALIGFRQQITSPELKEVDMQRITSLCRIRLFSLVALLAVLMWPQMAAGGVQEEAPEAPATPAEVPDATLEVVAKAYVEVLDIQEEYRPRIESSQSAEEAQRLQQEAEEEMVQAIEAQEGVTLEVYNTTIERATQSDPELGARLREHVQRELQARAEEED